MLVRFVFVHGEQLGDVHLKELELPWLNSLEIWPVNVILNDQYCHGGERHHWPRWLNVQDNHTTPHKNAPDSPLPSPRDLDLQNLDITSQDFDFLEDIDGEKPQVMSPFDNVQIWYTLCNQIPWSVRLSTLGLICRCVFDVSACWTSGELHARDRYSTTHCGSRICAGLWDNSNHQRLIRKFRLGFHTDAGRLAFTIHKMRWNLGQNELVASWISGRPWESQFRDQNSVWSVVEDEHPTQEPTSQTFLTCTLSQVQQGVEQKLGEFIEAITVTPETVRYVKWLHFPTQSKENLWDWSQWSLHRLLGHI